MPKRIVTAKENDAITKMLCKPPQPDYERIASKFRLSVGYVKRMHKVVKSNASKQWTYPSVASGGHQVPQRQGEA